MNEQIFIGTTFAVVCLVGMVRAGWLLEHSNRGQKLVQKVGEESALRWVQGMMLFGVLFGILLALNIIRPIRWEPGTAIQAESGSLSL